MYEITCKPGNKKDNFSAQVDPSDCQCTHYDKIPDLKIKLLQNQNDKAGKVFTMPRETYIKDMGNGKCKLLLNPNDMQIGANYGENYWVMGAQFMQA